MAWGDDDTMPEPLLGNGWARGLALLGATIRDLSDARQGKSGNALLGVQQMMRQDQALSRQQQAQKTMGDAMSLMVGKPAETVTYGSGEDATTINWNAQAPNREAAISLLAGNPLTAGKALDLMPKPLDPKDRLMTVGDSIVDITTGKPVYQAPSPFLFPGAPGMSSAGGGTGGTTTQPRPPAGPSASGGFGAALAQSENSGRVSGFNRQGYGGKYQFGEAALQDAGVYTPGSDPKDNAWLGQFNVPGMPEVKTAKDFFGNEAAQDAVFNVYKGGLEKQIADRGLDRFIGQTVGGAPITKDGIIAMMHLGGPTGAERFLTSGGTHNPADSNGTRLSDYASKFARTQVAQANTGTMTDASPARPAPAAGQWVRGIDKNGRHVDVEKNTATGEIRSVGGGSMFSGNSVEGQALNQLVESGLLTKEQALTWAAGKTATGPNGQLDFITPQAMRPAAPAAGGAAPPAITPVRQGQLAPQDKDAIMEADKAAEAAAGAVNSLNDALKLNRKAWGGAMAPIMQGADRMLPGEWGGTATTELENIIGTQALGQLKAIFGAAPTEGERKILMDLQGSITKSADEREVIFKRAIEAAQNRLQREQGRAKALRGGTYYTEGMPQQATQPAQQGGARVLRFDAQGNMIP